MEEKYYGQICQDDKITNDFRELHDKIVNEIIKFCNEHNIIIDTFSIDADGIKYSIPFNEWTAFTDSSFVMYENDIRNKNNETNKPFLLSM